MRCCLGLLIVMIAASTVEAAPARGLQFPHFFAPPPASVQLREAQIYDPYPLPDVGPSDYSARPLGFLAPPPEATRGRWPRPGTFPRVYKRPAAPAPVQ